MKAYLLFGHDNPVDGLVLGVILEKVRQIRRDRGITVPFPEDSSTVLDTVAKALLFNPDRCVKARSDKTNSSSDSTISLEAREGRNPHHAQNRGSREAGGRDVHLSRIIPSKADELEVDLREAGCAIGDVAAVERFVTGTLTELLGAQIDRTKSDWRLHIGNLPASLRAHLPDEAVLDVSFRSPTPKKHLYLGRNHPFVEALCQYVMAHALSRQARTVRFTPPRRCHALQRKCLPKPRCCCFAVATSSVKEMAQRASSPRKCWCGAIAVRPTTGTFSPTTKAVALLHRAGPPATSRRNRAKLFRERTETDRPASPAFDAVAEERNKHLVEAHERFSKFFRAGRYEVVYPVLPMDIMGLYILLPEGSR